MRVVPALVGAMIALGALGGGVWWATQADADPPQDAPIAALPALPVPPLPPRIADDPAYEACLALLPEDPAAALAHVRAQPAQSPSTHHCEALAWIADGRVNEGAAALEALAETGGLPPASQALLLDQAAEAWFQARAYADAFRATSRAKGLAPDDAALVIRHARAATLTGHEDVAIANLTDMLRTSPDRADALLVRAIVWRQMDRLDQARADINRAASLSPDDAEVLLERGIQRQLDGDLTGAREDWQRVVSLDPDSEAADLAEQNLALLDAGPRQR